MTGRMPADGPRPAQSVVVSLDGYRVAPYRLRALLRGCAVKDRRAFTRLYDALAPAVAATVRGIVPDRVRAEAVTSAAFVEAWHSARQHAVGDTDVAGWIEDLAVRHAGTPPSAGDVPPGQGRGDPTLAQLLQRSPERHCP